MPSSVHFTRYAFVFVVGPLACVAADPTDTEALAASAQTTEPSKGPIPSREPPISPAQPNDSASADDPADDVRTAWLHTEGPQILLPDDSPFLGRGANLHDTRGCNACTTQTPNAEEVIRRADVLIDEWGANWVRLVLESYGEPSVLADPAYLADIKRIVDHIGTKPGVYVLLSLWHDPTFTELGWPSEATRSVWEQLTMTFGSDSHVIFGLVNEPQQNYDGSRDADVWDAMNESVATIRRIEAYLGVPQHLIAVQGTGGWARRLDYYITRPIEAGGGANILYEVHIYDPERSFDELLTLPAQHLPVVIGEFGPVGNMSLQDCAQLMERAESLGVPYLAWTFHMRCPPNLIEDNSNGGCGVDMDLRPTSWGTQFKERLSRPWGR